MSIDRTGLPKETPSIQEGLEVTEAKIASPPQATKLISIEYLTKPESFMTKMKTVERIDTGVDDSSFVEKYSNRNAKLLGSVDAHRVSKDSHITPAASYAMLAKVAAQWAKEEGLAGVDALGEHSEVPEEEMPGLEFLHIMFHEEDRLQESDKDRAAAEADNLAAAAVESGNAIEMRIGKGDDNFRIEARAIDKEGSAPPPDNMYMFLNLKAGHLIVSEEAYAAHGNFLLAMVEEYCRAKGIEVPPLQIIVMHSKLKGSFLNTFNEKVLAKFANLQPKSQIETTQSEVGKDKPGVHAATQVTRPTRPLSTTHAASRDSEASFVTNRERAPSTSVTLTRAAERRYNRERREAKEQQALQKQELRKEAIEKRKSDLKLEAKKKIDLGAP
jgi:hypothetical protein